VLVLLLVAWLPGAARAQFGHPLKGQWSGQWESGGQSNRLLIDLAWDGTALTGVVNPGDEAATITGVTIDYADPTAWKVRLEARGTGASGAPVTIVAEGTLENLGAYARLLRGTWTEGDRSGPFLVTRN
jgi:hypothetical protein